MQTPAMPQGDLHFPDFWTIFVRPEPDAAHERSDAESFDIISAASQRRLKRAGTGEDPVLTPEVLRTLPDTLTIEGQVVEPQRFQPILGQADLRPLLGHPPFGKWIFQPSDNEACGRIAYVFIPIDSPTAQTATIGVGADLWVELWLNGEKQFDSRGETLPFPPTMADRLLPLTFQAGANLLVARYVSGKGSSMLTIGGPRELRAGKFNSLLADPILAGDAQWTDPALRRPGTVAEVVDLADRLELFVDDFLIDQLGGGAERRLHAPVPREVVLELNQPWEGNCNGCFQPVSIFHDGDRYRMYYKGANMLGPDNPCRYDYRSRERTRPEATCLALSDDGIRFTRVEAGLIEYGGSTANNLVWAGKQYFTPFLDTRPDVAEAECFKAISSHPAGGLGAYVSPDGYRWRLLAEAPIITRGAFDSQNLAFWDAARGCYFEYHRGNEPTGPRRGVRGIMVARSDDFVHWSDPVPIDYSDTLPLHMYTNCIRPYARAPHLLIGTPARFVTSRKKIEDHVDTGVCDAMLICSRDGHYFHRWIEAFIRPDTELENWADRNVYPAWGMLQTAPDTLSLYWCEHNGFPSLRLRRGTLRTDGFVSIHAGFAVGECLTRPFTFRGDRLIVNYATSAAGTVRFELCDSHGEALPGLGFGDSEVLFGNAIAHPVRWIGRTSLASLAGRPVRLRVRLQDADLYAIRFGCGHNV